MFVVVFCTSTSNLGDYLFPPGLPSGMHVCVLSPFSRVQLFVTLWTVCSLPGSSVYGILQARILKWVAMPSSRGSS